MKLEKIIEKIDRTQEIFIVVLSTIMTTVVLFNVFNRNVVKLTLGWPDELSRLLMIWLVYTAIPVCFARERNFKLSLITTFVFKKENRTYQFILNVFNFIYSALLFAITIQICLIMFESGQKSTGIGLPMVIAYGILPACFFVIILRILIKLFIFFRDNRFHIKLYDKI